MNRPYKNPDRHEHVKTLPNFIRWRKERFTKRRNKQPGLTVSPATNIHKLPECLDNPELIWIGHSTYLIRWQGLCMLTDPVWSGRIGLEKRMSRPAIALRKMPEVDVVIISHNHYDHLSFHTLKKLQGNPVFLVPEGLGRLFRKKGFDPDRVIEMKWGAEYRLHDFAFTFVPAQHWSGRFLFDRNQSLWGGWIIHSDTGDRTIYFAGDTGYFSGFKRLAEEFRIDLALLPIGAYEPEWFMSVYHMTPEQSIQAFLDCDGGTFIPMHYGAYRIADDTAFEALERLCKEWRRRKLATSRLKILKLGEPFQMKNPGRTST